MKNNLLSNDIVKSDITRYKKNSQASTFALLGIVFNCLYFMIMYGQQCGDIESKFMPSGIYPDGSYVYTWINGASVIINLAVLLGAFLCSEKLKNYQWKFCIVIWALAAIQIARIFIYPLITFANNIKTGSGTQKVFDYGIFVLLIVFLAASAASLIYSGIIGFTRAKKREKFMKDVEEGKIDLDGALNDTDAFALTGNGETVDTASSEVAEVESVAETEATPAAETETAQESEAESAEAEQEVE